MHCPSCGHDNIPGVDLCEDCGSDLAGLDLPEAKSGTGGRLLTDRIGDLPLAPRVTAEPAESVAAVVRRMREEKQGYALILSADRLVGIFTEHDVIHRVVGGELDAEKTPVGEVMTASPITLSGTEPPAHAIHRMVSQSFRHLPVTDQGELVGVLSIRGVLRYLDRDLLRGGA